MKKTNLFVPKALDKFTVYISYDRSYVERFLSCFLLDKEKREIGSPYINDFCLRAFFTAGGKLLATKLSLKFGFAVNAAGGSYNASR